MKDHKENFLIHRKCRLINPIKSEVGRICKVKNWPHQQGRAFKIKTNSMDRHIPSLT